MSLWEFCAAMSPSKNTDNEFPESSEAVLQSIPRLDPHDVVIDIRDRGAWLTIYLRPIRRNERGLLLQEVIEDGWTIDHIDLDNEHARAFKLKDRVQSSG